MRKFDQPGPCLELARAVVVAKIGNQRKLLDAEPCRIARAGRRGLGRRGRRAARAESIDSLRGHEGQAAAIYFGHFAGMLKSELAAEFDANGRQRRPPPDPVNACLSFAYSMLTHECTAALRTARLEPSIGAYHVSRPGRPALALDLMEPFRPLMADSVAITAFNRGELQPGHFLRTAAGAMFTDARPQGVLRRLRPADGRRGHAPRLRLQTELPPHVDLARPHDRRLAQRRSSHAGFPNDAINVAGTLRRAVRPTANAKDREQDQRTERPSQRAVARILAPRRP